MPLSVVPAGNLPGPAHERRHPVGALPVGVFLAAERRGAGVRPGVVVRAVVGRVQDDRVVGDAEIVELLEQFADVAVVLDHPVRVLVLAGFAAVLALTWVRKCMRVPFHHKQGFPAFCWRWMKSLAAATVSSSIVSMRFLVSGPVSSTRPSAVALMTRRVDQTSCGTRGSFG